MKECGLAVIVRSGEEFNTIKNFLGGDVLYMDWVSEMVEVETSIVIWYLNPFFSSQIFSVGTVGSSRLQKRHGVRLVEFNDFFKIVK